VILAARTALLVVVLLGVGFAAGYFVGRGPRWVLWENVGNTVQQQAPGAVSAPNVEPARGSNQVTRPMIPFCGGIT
jgi:hypothetical protein